MNKESLYHTLKNGISDKWQYLCKEIHKDSLGPRHALMDLELVLDDL